MWLRRLQLRNVRAFRAAEISFPRSGLVLLVGANNVGKTALLSVFDVLRSATSIAAARFSGAPEPARLIADFELDEDERGQVFASAQSSDAWVASGALRDLRFVYEERVGAMRLLEIYGSLVSPTPALLARSEWPEASLEATDGVVTQLAQLPLGPPDPSAGWPLPPVAARPVPDLELLAYGLEPLQPIVVRWRESVFHFQAQRPGTTASRTIASDPALRPTGENLPEALLFLNTDRASDPAWGRVLEVVQDVVPDLGELETPTFGNQVSVAFSDPHLAVRRNLKELGGGVEQIVLAAYVGERQPARSTILLEEPESHLHSDAQRRLLPHLRRWAEDRLLIVATHSALLLDQSVAAATPVWLVERRAGEATVRAADAALPDVLSALGVRLSDVLSAERVLVVEGDSDADVLREWFGSDLARARVALVAGGRGGDIAWHIEAFSEWYEATDVLSRRVTFLRDRDELSDVQGRRLEETGKVRVLDRRELENYLLDSEAIAAVLADRLVGAGRDAEPREPALVEACLRTAADGMRGAIVLKRVIAELGPLRLLDRATTTGLLAVATSAAALHDVLDGRLEAARASLGAMADLWQACEEGLAAEWDARWRELAPGADLLEAVFDVNGLRFDKGRDPALIARAMGAAPVELAELVREIVAGP